MAKVLTPAQAAALLQVSEKTVLNWLRAGSIPGRKVGRLWRIPEAALLAFVGTSARGE